MASAECTEPGCEGAHHARGFCIMHYRRFQRGSLTRSTGAPGAVPDLTDVPTGKLQQAWAAGLQSSEAEAQSRARMMLALWVELTFRGLGPELPEPKRAPDLFVLITGVLGAALFGKHDPHLSTQQMERLAAVID